MNILQELVIKHAEKQRKLIDNITEKAPILKGMPFWKSSHEFHNVEENLTAITGASFVNLNAVLAQMKVDTHLTRRPLAVMGGEMWVPQDQARAVTGVVVGNPAPKYFAQKTERILNDAGETTEQNLIYDHFREYAVDNDLFTSAGSSAAGATRSLVFIRYEKEVCGGLYSPVGMASKELLKMESLNGGTLGPLPSAAGYPGVNGYGIQVKGYFGFMIASARNIWVIANIDTSNLPTAPEIEAALVKVRRDKNTVIWGHPETIAMLYSIKDSKMNTEPTTRMYDTSFDNWGGTPFIRTYQMYNGTEAVVS